MVFWFFPGQWVIIGIFLAPEKSSKENIQFFAQTSLLTVGKHG